MAAAVGLAWLVGQVAAPVVAGSADRTLWLYHAHTGQTGKFTFKRNGQYDQNVLKQMNVFLADWRTKAPARMDPQLFDLLWEVYQEVGGTKPYNIVSAYREPKTNAMLRGKSANSGVAENSQHMLGKAMDVFIPGVPLATLRAATMRHQVGGVGFYPTSGSPFVHMDTGNVRAWPRMTRAQLEKVFPDGRTLHLPVDGKPISDSGRKYAMAEWSKCHQVPCGGASAAPLPNYADDVRVASLEPTQRSVATIAVSAPVPMRLPGATLAADADTLPETVALTAAVPALSDIVPFSKTSALLLATRGALPRDGETALTAITDSVVPPMPTPRALLTPRDEPVLTAYAPEATSDPATQRALQQLIERESATVPRIDTKALRGADGIKAGSNIFDMTWTAVSEANADNDTALAAALDHALLGPVAGFPTRDTDLVAPEIDHVNETLATPVLMTDMHYADMTEPEGYLDNTAELGPLANRLRLENNFVAPARYDRFTLHTPLLVASR